MAGDRWEAQVDKDKGAGGRRCLVPSFSSVRSRRSGYLGNRGFERTLPISHELRGRVGGALIHR